MGIKEIVVLVLILLAGYYMGNKGVLAGLLPGT